ncbi:hypothetical protein [Alloactinosynnema sp. L-07]|uniref:hypothetical protein n=1 Tax=Alloactinosynnema sp. L-07 TaxID=1653480 RepID=UPI00065EF53D|nr:hypothetical protein [Alloactinosynnema sp. L-07]CRK59854.1 hypothetical protein [Alloactinosynnema sp. L-07]
MEIITMKHTPMAARLILAAAAICVGLGTAACTGDAKTADSAAGTTAAGEAKTDKTDPSATDGPVATGAPAPSSVPAAASEPPVVLPALPKGAPKGFPVVSGGKINPVAGSEGSFVVVGEGAEKILRFYREALPKAGYKITADTEKSVDFDGNSTKGTVAIVGDSVSVTFKA